MPPLPSLPSGATVADRGVRAFTVAVGETRVLDASIAIPAPGPCPSFVWTVAWRASGPLSATVVTQTDRIATGTGSWGTAEMGCAWIELRNVGTATVSGELAYVTGSR